ncbi:MAG: 50S ribosomal protein L6 [Candidatus Bathyarchaeota archaeon]|nr:50S ribosomal protein L6 [Candidatus Bathyarchaeota archaeon]
MPQTETRAVEVPDDVTVSLEGKTVEVRGEKGRLLRDFSHAPISIQREDGEIIVSAPWARRKTAALVGTICSHINNMIKGVTKGFTYKLKIVYAHFPITVRVEGDRIVIENFIGERNPRKSKIVGDTKVTVKGDDVFVQGVNIEDVSQTAANIEQATRVKEKDPRKFLDGIYVYEKLEGIVE